MTRSPRLSHIIFSLLIISLISIASAKNPTPSAPPANRVDAQTKTNAMKSYANLPLAFVSNQGQMDSTVRFYTQGPGGALYFTADGIISDIVQSVKPSAQKTSPNNKNPETVITKHLVLKKRFLHTNPQCEILGEAELPGKINYLTGNNPSGSISNIRTYQQVRYKNLYPGIDLIYFGTLGKLQYRFEIDPSAHSDAKVSPVSQIQFTMEGATKLRKKLNGTLLIYTPMGTLVDKKPEASQLSRSIPAHYTLLNKNTAAYSVGPYDTQKLLTIQ